MPRVFLGCSALLLLACTAPPTAPAPPGDPPDQPPPALFSVQTTGASPELVAALKYTAAIWGDALVSPVTIDVSVVYTDLGGGGALAVTLPNGRRDTAGTPLADTWYPSALAGALAAEELAPGEADMDIYVNSSAPLYFGLDGQPPAGQYDFVSLLLHEVGHGLGMATLSGVGGGVGGFGLFGADDILPLVTSFPFPELGGRPSAFDRLLEDADQQPLTDELLYPNGSEALGAVLESGAVYFSGVAATQANGGSPPRLHAPDPYDSGPSIQHFDEADFPASGEDSLLTPFLAPGEVVHEPGAVVLGVLSDIGWTLR